MLTEVDIDTYRHYFPEDPHPFISESFLELNKGKTEGLVRLIDDNRKPTLGLVAGIKDKSLISPFSAPFGGFHFRKENIYISFLDNFLRDLKEYVASQDNLWKIEITLPPDIYHSTLNAKALNSLIRNHFKFRIPEITSWINLGRFDGSFSHQNSREGFRQAIRNKLQFQEVCDEREMEIVFNIIKDNRTKYGRPIYMTFEDVISTAKLWPVDFFKVTTIENKIVASAILYRAHRKIVYATFWDDNTAGRNLKSIDFLTFHLWL